MIYPFPQCCLASCLLPPAWNVDVVAGFGAAFGVTIRKRRVCHDIIEPLN